MYFTPTTASRPILCMFGIEKMDGMNMLLLLPEIAVFDDLVCRSNDGN